MECAICLGPGRKRELELASPLLVAAGALGYAPLSLEAATRAAFGAFITPPLTARPLAGAASPRLARTTAGYVQHTGLRNPGLRQAIRLHARSWQRAGLPVIVALYGQTSGEFGDLAAKLAEVDWVQGLELHFPRPMEADEMAECTRAASAESDVPCLVRLPFQGTIIAARACAEAGADALVVAAPPYARAMDEDGAWVYGPLHSPALAPAYAELLYEVAGEVDVPLIGRGGIADIGDVLALVSAGAVAVQVDSLLWVQPAAGAWLYQSLEGEMTRRGAADWQAFVAHCRCNEIGHGPGDRTEPC